MSDEFDPTDDDLDLDDDSLLANTQPAPVMPAAGVGGGNARLDVILDIDLPLVVRFGRTELPLKTLTQLGPGSVIDLARSPHEPVEVLVSNRVVARGEVVVVQGNYGIRILDVVSPGERMQGVEV
jgi:flagellar motor switch protein FliN/FliY